MIKNNASENPNVLLFIPFYLLVKGIASFFFLFVPCEASGSKKKQNDGRKWCKNKTDISYRVFTILENVSLKPKKMNKICNEGFTNSINVRRINFRGRKNHNKIRVK